MKNRTYITTPVIANIQYLGKDWSGHPYLQYVKPLFTICQLVTLKYNLKPLKTGSAASFFQTTFLNVIPKEQI